MSDMTMTKRRVFLKGALATGAIGAGLSAGLFTPGAVLAAWNKSAFEAKSLDDAMEQAKLAGAQSGDIRIKAPDIAENGAVVPITISTDMDNIEQVALLASGNLTPLTSSYKMADGAKPYISTRIKMAKTGDIIAVARANGKVYMNKKEVKVTIGGCGG